MIAVMAAVPSLRSRMVTQRSLMRMATSGLPRDFLLAVGLLIPTTVFTASYQDKWPEAIQHAMFWLLIGLAIRFAWIPFTRFVPESENLSIAWAVCVAGLMGTLPLFLLAGWFRFPQPHILFTIPVTVGVLLAFVGWDRVIAFARKIFA